MSKPTRVKFLNKNGDWVEETCHDILTCREHKEALNRTRKMTANDKALAINFVDIETDNNVMSIFEEEITLGFEPDSIEQALIMAESVIGKTFNEINVKGTFDSTVGDNSKNKGYLGNLFQENIYGLDANSDKGADLKSLGVELKVVPLVRDRKGNLKPKERIVANIINFEEEDLSGDFTKSSFFDKNNKSLFVFYEVTDRKNQANNRIVKVLYHDLTESSEYEQIVTDYKTINQKIANGDAHNISGRDTVFLEACTKGSGKGKDLRKQPKSDTLAKQRAYALKTKYVQLLLDK